MTATAAFVAPISFEVLGLPAPQGSHTAIMRGTKPVIVEGRRGSGRARHRSWRGAVAEAARDIVDTGLYDTPLDGPLELVVVFRLPMPASRPKRLQRAGIAWHTTRPDLSKLVRATEDALTDAGLIADDARIARLLVTKVEVVGWTGAVIDLAPAGELPIARGGPL